MPGMNTTDETDATRPETGEHDDATATASPIVLSVNDAAQAFGVSPGAIRKRIERGQLSGQKIRGQWQVVLDRLPGDETTSATTATDATRHEYDNTTRQTRPDATTSQVVSQSEADRYAAIVAPFLDRLEAQAQRIGTLETQLASVTEERDTLEARQAAPERAGAPVDHVAEESPGIDDQAQPETPAAWWRKWWPW